MSLYRIEFPDYDAKLYIPKGFEDASYHNDACPRAEKIRMLSDYADFAEVKYILWQDYADPNKREYEFGKRYVFAIEVNGEVVFEYCSDDLDNVKAFINDCVK